MLKIKKPVFQFYWFLLLPFSFLLISCPEGSDNKGIIKADLSEAFEEFKEEDLEDRRFKHSDLVPLIQKRTTAFSTEILGKSVEGREIYRLSYGKGDTKVLLWSQMHGDESTATMALFDLFNFLEGKEDDFEKIRQTLYHKLSLQFIPMVNPDGAEQFKRRNALDIDLNRDAINTVSPEAKILKNARDDFLPEFGFNLHDQNIYYNVKGSPNPATISLLAPAFNEAVEINEVRSNAMKVIVGINKLLQEEIPGHVGKYDDAFEPRAFGDNFQKWGTSTILIESGGYPDDPEKQYIRKLNFMIILNALYEIATKTYLSYEEEAYFAIPDNDSKLMDLVIRGVKIKEGSKEYVVDLGIRRREVNSGRNGYYVVGEIEEIGDLSVFHGYVELDAAGMEFVMGKLSEEEIHLSNFSNELAIQFLDEGYLALKSESSHQGELHGFPILIFSDSAEFKTGHSMGNPANFFLQEKGKLKYAVVNGYLIDLEQPKVGEWKQRVY